MGVGFGRTNHHPAERDGSFDSAFAVSRIAARPLSQADSGGDKAPASCVLMMYGAPQEPALERQCRERPLLWLDGGCPGM
mmetsp:Transcript_13319/g.41444  ORF Transcript_13319/g.41444 Transcript_13319/m.41444 type:complete len:80 (+) Transcript_13319:226-465(+)